ncbi:hypothetical protein BJY16_005606 [Actinoplanes octamycinicus]|uniref:DUF998 domain-containing protein n=1 Tax=Actinoplanes octamycinicus TaxID=135948 RepID=A0A7W7H1U4_9ACTN|nr:DUF6069 family protein [Actinoplanes octamycinicus]MBB4742147.1 hypothetical protein [Actinoplanes octamycinicus]
MTNQMQTTAFGTTGRTARLITIGAATTAVLVQWTSNELWADTPLTVVRGGATQHLGAGAVTVTALVAGLAAWGLLAVLERTTRRPVRAFRIIATVGLLLSLAGPLGSGADPQSTTTLLAMHTTVAAALILGLPRRHC